MDRIDAMKIFVTAVEAGSFSAAGRALGMPLTTVSRRMADLESHLRARLLHRSTRRLVLTAAGQSYLAACKRILGDVEEAERAAAGEYAAPKGELIVTAPTVFGRLHVLPVATRFLLAYPDVDLRLVLGDRVLNLVDDHVDIAVRVGELPDSSLVARRIGTIREVTCASPDYCARRGTPQHPHDLITHDGITFDGLMPAGAWHFEANGAAIWVNVRSRLTVNAADAAIDAAIEGVGIARVLSYQIDRALRAGELALLLEEFEPPARPVSLVHAHRGRLPIKMRAFIDFALPRLGERLGGHGSLLSA